MFPLFWKRRSFWENSEIICALLAALMSAVTASVPQPSKQLPASLAGIFFIFAAMSKLRSKRIETREISERKQREDTQKEQWRETVERLKRDAETKSQEQAAELAEMRGRYASQAKCAIEVLLEEFHRKYFRREAEHEKYKHRTTLFKCVENNGKPGAAKRLVIYARAGIHKDSTRFWPVDDNDIAKCRGIAGRIWFLGVGNVTTAASDWPADETDAVQKARYAQSLQMTMDEAESLNVKSKVFTGSRIMARGEKWCVILLDSIKEGHISDGQYEKRLLSEYADLISSVVQRMEL